MTRPFALAACAFLALAACAANKPSQRDAIVDDLREMHDAARQYVKDPQRAARVHRSVDGLQVELLALEETIADLRFQMRTLNARPEATRAQFDAMLDRFEGEHKALRARILDRHFELVAATTAEEWKDLWPHERDALAATER